MSTLIANLADMHTGGTTALFPDSDWDGEHQTHRPSKNQQLIHAHFMDCADLLKKRGDRKLIIVNSGDAIEGNHHGSHEVVTRILYEQAAIHEDLMVEFMERCSFYADDRLIYVRGTETHAEQEEAKIASDLGAEIADHAELIVNGRRLWFIHKGVSPGSGANRGNSLRNKLRDIYFDCLEGGEPIPDLVSYAHVHTPDYNTFVRNGRTIHGYICPSWQMKTRFAYSVAPVVKTKIGMVVTEILDGGEIMPPYFHLLKTESAVVV